MPAYFAKDPTSAAPKKQTRPNAISSKQMAKRKAAGEHFIASTIARKPAEFSLSRKGAIPKKKRKPSEFARIYGSRARVRWVIAQPCAVRTSMCRGLSQNAHVCSDEQHGMGRKSSYRCIAPLCDHHHRALHSRGVLWFIVTFGVTPDELAAQTQQRWLLHCGRNSLNPETGKSVAGAGRKGLS